MKKVSYFLLVAVLGMLTSCGVGVYYPHSHNLFGAQTTVQLNQANFRVVRDVEAVVEVNNTRLSRSSVEKSAYGQLLRNARLTGSQVLINVVIEEIRRDTRWKCAQYVAARATIIEFLDENGNPMVSKSYRPVGISQSVSQSGGTESVGIEAENRVVEAKVDEMREVIVQYEEYVAKLNSFGWGKSPMYRYYTELVSEFEMANTKEAVGKIDTLNCVIERVFKKEVNKVTLEKCLREADLNGFSVFDVFVSYCK